MYHSVNCYVWGSGSREEGLFGMGAVNCIKRLGQLIWLCGAQVGSVLTDERSPLNYKSFSVV